MLGNITNEEAVVTINEQTVKLASPASTRCSWTMSV
jgi:hypothetical protein